MTRLSKIIDAVSIVKGGWESAWLRNKEHLIMESGQLTEPYKKSDMVYICISTTMRAISQVPLVVYVETSDGKTQIDYDDPLGKRIKRPNYLMDEYSFKEAIVGWLFLDGESFVIPFPPGVKGVPPSLWVVPGDHMEEKKDANGHLVGWDYRPDRTKSKPIPLGVDEVCHIWFWNPHNPMRGMSPLEAGSMSVMTDYKAAKYNQLFFDQGASSKGAFSTEGTLSSKQYTRLKGQIDARYGGYKNAHRDMLLEKGLKYTAISRSHKDMDFLKGRDFDGDRIMQILGMKKSIISVDAEINKATAVTDEKNWWKSTNLPVMNLIISALNFTLYGLKPSNRSLGFDISTIEALHEDFSDKVETAGKLVKIGFTANEVNRRLELGFADAPWREYAFIPQGTVPIGPGMPPQRPNASGESALQAIEVRAGDTKLLPYVAADLSNGPRISRVKPQVKAPQNSDRQLGHAWKQVVRGAATIEKSFTSKTKKAFLGMRKAILEWLYSQNSQKAESRPFELTQPISNITELSIKPIGKLKAEADALYETSLMTGLKSISTELGQAMDIDLLSTPEAIKFLSNKQLQIVGVGDTVNKNVASAIVKGMDKQETIGQIADRVKHVFNTSSNRAKSIARTEVFSSVNFGRHETIKSTSFRKVKWFTALDEDVRLHHYSMHGQVKDIEAKWIVKGESLDYPGDPAGSASNIINCRCIEIVDVSEAAGFYDTNKADVPLDEIEALKAVEGFGSVSNNRVAGAVSRCYT